jgi:hypothetical protein
MFSRASRLGLGALLLFGALASACDGCVEDPDPQGGASITVRFPQGSSLESDGFSRIVVALKATNAERQPDTSPINIEAPTGFLAPVGEAPAGAALTATPDETGALEFEFGCEPGSDGTVAIGVANANATATVNVTCARPQGQIVILIDDSDCLGFQADGEDQCRMGLRVFQRADGGDIEQSGVATVRVTNAAPSGEGDTNRNILFVTPGVAPQSIVNVTIANGDGEFFVQSPLTPEVATLEVAFGNAIVTRDLRIDAFVDRSTLTISALRSEVVGGTSVDLTISAKNPRGDAAAAEPIDVTIVGGPPAAVIASGALGPAGRLDQLLLDSAGTARVTVTTPAVSTSTAYTVAARYRDLTATFVVTATEADALILNLALDPESVRSDVPGEGSTTLTVNFTQNGARVAGGTVTLNISDTARVRFAGAPGATELLVVEADFDAEGNAEVDLVVVPNVPPGIVRISALARAGNRTVARDVALNVDRAPILQSIVAQPLNPSVIGVRGSVVASSTVVRFQLFDDRGAPMAGVPVVFAANLTSDRGIQVGRDDVSSADGFVQTVVAAGTIAGPVSVLVTAQPVSPDPGVVLDPLTVQSPTIAVVGGLPNFISSFMACDKAIPATEGTTFNCSVTLVDRFSNLTADQTVQFRAEGSGTTAVAVTGSGGGAAAQLVVDDGDTQSGASVTLWSYGAIPSVEDIVAGRLPARFATCFDGTITTPCDLLDLCDAAPAFCPLPLGCLDDASVADGLLVSGLDATNPAIDTYVATHRACGFPTTCLRGRLELSGGVPGFDGDECPVALGCMDYSSATECPADGVMTVIASTRGEEGFTDGNGNGVFDFFDDNGNGRHDLNEALKTRAERCLGGRCELSGAACAANNPCTGSVPLDDFVDLTEPFLDKNDSCSRDDFTNVPRFRFTPAQRVKHTDLFNDVDGNGVFGYGDPNAPTLTNGLYDADTEIFMTSHVLLIGDPVLRFGAPCSPGAPGCTDNITPSGLIGIDPGGLPSSIAADGSIAITYRWADLNGNCPSPGFTARALVTVTGPVEISGKTQLNLTDKGCGFAGEGNALAPYCEELPDLGAPSGSVIVTANCEGKEEPATGSVSFTLGDEEESYTFIVRCGA